MADDWKKEEAFEDALAAASSLVELKRLWDARIESGDDSKAGELQCNLARIISQAISIAIEDPLLRPKKWSPGGDVIRNVDGWLNLTCTLDLKKAIRKAICLFNKATELGCLAGYYYLSELGRILQGHYSAWNVDYEIGDTPPPEASLYWEYKKLHDDAWNKALSLDEPHALYVESANDYDSYYDRRFDEKIREGMLERAAKLGYPQAVYEYALKLKETNPEKAYEMIEAVSWSRRVCSLKAWHARAEQDEWDSQYGNDDDSEPRLSDYYDDLEELELNTRGDGFD